MTGVLYTPVLLAGIPVDGIIYLVVLVFWVLSKIGKAGKRPKSGPGAPSTPDPMSSPRPMDAEIRELFETITGQKWAQPPPPPSPPPLVRSYEPEQEEETDETTAPTRPQPSYATAASAPQRSATPQRRTSVLDREETASPIQPAISTSAIAHVMRQSVSSMPAMTIPAMGFSASGSSNASAVTSPLIRSLRRSSALREAIAQRAVLGPPRAYDPI